MNIHICFAKHFQPFFIVMFGQYPGCQRLFTHSFQFRSRLCRDTPTPKYSSTCNEKKFSGTRDMYAKTCPSYTNWNDFFFFFFRHRHAEDHLCTALQVPIISCAWHWNQWRWWWCWLGDFNLHWKWHSAMLTIYEVFDCCNYWSKWPALATPL